MSASGSGPSILSAGTGLRSWVRRVAIDGRWGRLAVAAFAVAAAATGSRDIAADTVVTTAPDVAVKAAFLYNFAKFAEWPALSSAAPIVVCIVGDDAIATALADTVRGQRIGDHSVDVSRPRNSAAWPVCHVLFLAEAERRLYAEGLVAIQALPVLTVSDGKGFSEAGGIIELYAEGGRMRFAINVDAVDRSGLRLSSRLLGLSKVIRNHHVQ